MTDSAATRPTRFRSAGLSQRKPTRFALVCDPAQRALIAQDLGLLALYQLEFLGQIEPFGRDEFRLQAQLSARLEQACVVTLAPVPAVVSEPVLRRFVVGLPPPDADELEIPEDDGPEPMPDTLDLIEIATEALMLALPLYPRAPGAELGQKIITPPGAAPIVETVEKPFSALSTLADLLKLPPKAGEDGTG